MRSSTDGGVRIKPRHPADPSRQLSISCATKAEAEAIKAELAAMRRRVKLGLEDRDVVTQRVARLERLTVREMLSTYAESRTNVRTRRAIMTAAGYLAPLAARDVRELGGPVLARWYDQARKRLAGTTLYTAWRYLRSAWSYAVAMGAAPAGAPPWGSWSAPRAAAARQWITEAAHVQALLGAAAEFDRKSKMKTSALAAVALGVLAGLRQGEICALSWEDVRQDEGGEAVLRIRYQAPQGWARADGSERSPGGRPVARVKGGSRAQRQPVAMLHVSPALARVLEAQRERLVRWGVYRDDGPVCPNITGGYRLSGCALGTDTLRRIACAAGIPYADRLVVHSLRHTFASMELRYSGGDLAATQRRTRHASLAALEPYAHALGSMIPRAAQPAFAVSVEPPAVAALPAAPPRADTRPSPPKRERGAPVPWARALAVWLEDGSAAADRLLAPHRERAADRARRRAERRGKPGAPEAKRARARFDRQWEKQQQQQQQRSEVTP